jgi:hypothetical protein
MLDRDFQDCVVDALALLTCGFLFVVIAVVLFGGSN